MKRYFDLTPEQQEMAIDWCSRDILHPLATARHTSPNLALQKQVDYAFKNCHADDNPYAAYEYIILNCKHMVRDEAIKMAEVSYYPEVGDRMMPNIANKQQDTK